MHHTSIPDWTAGRGKALNHFPTFDLASTALLVIDMQNLFVHEDQPMGNPHARDIVPNINRIVGSVRGAEGKVFWIRHTFSDETPFAVPHWQMSPQNGWVELGRKMLRPGQFAHEVYGGLDRKASDAIVNKHRASAFETNSSDLGARLKKANVETVIVTGTYTNACRESTARSASMQDYKVLFVADATATATDEEHNAALLNLRLCFADVLFTDELLRRIEVSRTTLSLELARSA
jgi:nicotinamidase-related amidase